MKQIISFFSSTRLMAVLLLIFAGSIGIATFIENDFGTDSARKLIYNAKWFELLLFLGSINIVAVIVTTKMYKKAKLTLFAFHLAFVVIIAGAGITRYFGSEGSMHIREGEESSSWNTTQTYLDFYISDQNSPINKSYPLLLAPVSKNRFRAKFNYKGHKILAKLTEYIHSAERVLLADPEGVPYIHLVTSSAMRRQDAFLAKGQNMKTSDFTLSFVEEFDTLLNDNTVQVTSINGVLYYLADFPVSRLSMANQEQEVLEANKVQPLLPTMLHYFNEVPIVVKQYLPSARIDAQAASIEQENPLSAVRLSVSCDGDTKSIVAFGSKNQRGQFNMITINDIDIAVNYGPIVEELPFKLRLNDFILKRYPGSESPSWYESNVQLVDAEKGVNREERIFMNHILKHRGYRFYQSSYDTDEYGTVLSINRDGVGTTLTYLGYLIMALGMLLSLLNRKSRFFKLAVRSESKTKILKLLVIGILVSGMSPLLAQQNREERTLPIIPSEMTKDFGKILVQDNGGRIKPLNTLASEVLRKVSRKEVYKGQSPEQVLVGMLVYPMQWQNEPLIKISHSGIQEILNTESNYAAFLDFFSEDSYGGYILKEYVEEAYRKKPAYRSKFDNEIIRVDERMNIAYMIYSGAVFRLFPDPDDDKYTWYSPLTAPNVFTKKDSVFTRSILGYYAEEVQKSLESQDWKNPDEIIKAIKIFQTNYGAAVLPPKARINAEAFYNNANIYKHITRIYLLVGLLLLIIQFVHIFAPRFSIRRIFWVSFAIIAGSLVFHTLALGLRWYIAGHAPWSNGYEALTFIAWAAILAGIIFSRKSEISLSTTAVLAGLILQTAHLSWMDPQITLLVPVLQSYWLVIHVAVITASYGFLGLAALVAFVNLLLLFFQNHKNYNRLDAQINQISAVIEMSLIVGLYLLAIGTFLGGVWANESWGRYWAWDPKETWALVTVILYAVILHLRLVPGLKGRVIFNASALIGFGSVLMTYFGVNYYLSGLHSYAKGDPLPVPPLVYYSIATVTILSLLALYNQSRLKKLPQNDEV